MYCYGTFLFEHDVISLSVYVCFIVFRHDMAEITVESGVKHHNLNPLTPDLSLYSKALCLKRFLKSYRVYMTFLLYFIAI